MGALAIGFGNRCRKHISTKNKKVKTPTLIMVLSATMTRAEKQQTYLIHQHVLFKKQSLMSIFHILVEVVLNIIDETNSNNDAYPLSILIQQVLWTLMLH